MRPEHGNVVYCCALYTLSEADTCPRAKFIPSRSMDSGRAVHTLSGMCSCAKPHRLRCRSTSTLACHVSGGCRAGMGALERARWIVLPSAVPIARKFSLPHFRAPHSKPQPCMCVRAELVVPSDVGRRPGQPVAGARHHISGGAQPWRAVVGADDDAAGRLPRPAGGLGVERWVWG
eukprot:360056-Chlamydomonas_euryale.AAC.20